MRSFSWSPVLGGESEVLRLAFSGPEEWTFLLLTSAVYTGVHSSPKPGPACGDLSTGVCRRGMNAGRSDVTTLR